MTNRILRAIFAAGVCATVSMPVVPVQADDTGLAQAIHTVRREGRKLCQADHFHTGTGAGASSKKEAMGQAVGSWEGFTAAEYGSDWASFRKAGSKSAKCSTSGGSWSCEVQARPCK